MFDYIVLLITVYIDCYLFYITAKLFIKPRFNTKISNMIFIIALIILTITNSIDIIGVKGLSSSLPLIIDLILILIISKDSLKRKFVVISLVLLTLNILMVIIIVLLNLPFISYIPVGMGTEFSDLLYSIFGYTVLFIVVSYIYLQKTSPAPDIRNPFVKFIIVYLSVALVSLYSILFYYNQKQYWLDLKQLSIILFISIILIIAVSVRMFQKLHYFLKKENEKEMQLQYYKNQQDFYFTFKESLDELRRLHHDTKHYYHTIYTYIENNDIDGILSIVQPTLDKIDKIPIISVTNNAFLSAILSAKKKECIKYQIKFEPLVIVPELNIPDIDIAIILGNLLDNAIEASKHVKLSKRSIFLHIEYKEPYIEITCNNHYITPLKTKGKLFITSKSNTKKHGFGLQSIVKTIAKYNGYSDFIAKNNIFSAYIIIKNT